jgi:hypothetical protein
MFFNLLKSEPSDEEKKRNEVRKSNSSTMSLVRDFPWLWSMTNKISAKDGGITVSQNMEDLKTVLSQMSTQPRFELWAVTSDCSYYEEDYYNQSSLQLKAREGEIWAESVRNQLCNTDAIQYLVVLTRPEVLRPKQILIFRNPEKKSLNCLVKLICRLHGHDDSFLISDGGYVEE